MQLVRAYAIKRVYGWSSSERFNSLFHIPPICLYSLKVSGRHAYIYLFSSFGKIVRFLTKSSDTFGMLSVEKKIWKSKPLQ